MTLSKRLREEARKKLGIKSRQLHNRINDFAVDRKIADRDVALLVLAYEKHIDVRKPRYKVRKDKLDKFEAELNTQKTPAPVSIVTTRGLGKKKAPVTPAQTRRLLKFKDKNKYPEVFYDRLESEINTAYNNPALPNAVLMLSRKLIENLVYNLLEYKFGGQNIKIYYDTNHRRAHDFAILLDNLKDHKKDFGPDQEDIINSFLALATPFRRDANSKVHKVMEYLETMSQIRKLKIPEMTEMLIKLIDRVKNP